jgi:serine/threonine-protein kinase
VTSPGPLPKRRRPAFAAAAFVIAILTAAGAGIAGTWLVLRGERPTGAASAAAPPQATPLRSVASPSDRAVETSGPELTPPQPEDPRPPASSSAPNVDRMRPARPSADAASAPKPCDPPYFIDNEGIRRVKRECF